MVGLFVCFGWLVGCMIGWLVGCLDDWLVGWLVGWLVAWVGRYKVDGWMNE